MSAYNTKNYTEQGGAKTVIGGELVIEGKLTLEVGSEIEGLPVAEYQEDSTATTVAALKDNFNALLAALKDAGLMSAEQTR